ncbi:MAG: ribosome hibernation-promoting factor, HPF/YfiA family [Magnetospiraceae bacterium]
MDITVKGKNLDVGDALRGHVTDAIETGVSKLFTNPLEGSVTFSKEAHNFKVDISVHVGRDILIQGTGAGGDPYGAFDGGMDRIAKQLRRYKRRLVTRMRDANPKEDAIAAQQYLIAPEEDDVEQPEGHEPTIVAEMRTVIPTLTVGEAVMHMDLTNHPVVMFRNSGHGGLNVVYRREDGHVGWIDPELAGK